MQRNWSLAKVLANKSPAEQQAFLSKLTKKEQQQLFNSWRFLARPNQLPPPGDWINHLILAGRGFGKSLCNQVLTLTTEGWKPLGQVNVGDFVFDEQGNPTRVLAVHDPEVKKAYRLTFSDGETLDACEDHQWVTWEHKDRKRHIRKDKERPEGWVPPKEFPTDWADKLPISTQELVDTFTHSTRQDTNHCIPLAKPLQYPEQDLIIDPWTLGYWLGNGCSNSLSAHLHDADFVEQSYKAKLSRRYLREGVLSCNWSSTLPLGDLGLRGTKAHTKFIPEKYKRGSVEQRRALLAGLLDSDGHMALVSGHIEFCSASHRLATDLLELVRSLGEKPVLATQESRCYGKNYGLKYRVTWRPNVNPFRSPRKAAAFKEPGNQALRNQHRMIVAFEEIPPKPMRCLTVDSPNSMFLVGKGLIPTHNTRTGAEWVVEQAVNFPGTRIAAIGPTAGAVRDTMIEGESGLMACAQRAGVAAEYFPSKRRIVFPNGTWVECFSAEEPERLRGPQFHAAWCDELCAWTDAVAAWDMLQFCLRLGKKPRVVITTTPKPTRLIKQLIQDPKTHITKGSTFDNSDNLAPSFREQLIDKYSNTRLGRQEIEAEILDDAPGALWDKKVIDKTRLGEAPKGLYVVIGVDPAVTANAASDLTGIVVCASDVNGYYVLEDLSGKYKPAEWIEKVYEVFNKYKADLIVAETNQGGDLLKELLQQRFGTLDIPYKGVHATQGKRARAEPIAMLYEQGKVHHVGELELLEIELTSWDPTESVNSPDRLDAMVWALTELYRKGRLYAEVHIDPTLGRSKSPWGKL